jgi:hypothetical protein
MTTTQRSADKSFALEPGPRKGEIPARVLTELIGLKNAEKAASKQFADAIEAQGEKYSIPAKALRRYVSAIIGVKIFELSAECTSLQALIDSDSAGKVAADARYVTPH